METSGGLMNVWQQGDAVTRFVALLLLAMSLASWVVMILKALDQARLRRQAQRVEAFWESPDYDAGLQALGGPGAQTRCCCAARLFAASHRRQSAPVQQRALAHPGAGSRPGKPAWGCSNNRPGSRVRRFWGWALVLQSPVRPRRAPNSARARALASRWVHSLPGRLQQAQPMAIQVPTLPGGPSGEG